MPPNQKTDVLDAARAIRNELPSTGILLLSTCVDDVQYAMKLMAGGPGIGYVLKSCVNNVADLIDALQRLADGVSFVDPGLVRELLSARRREASLAVLSTRERDVLALMAEGRSNVGIGRRLWISEPTVEKHVSNILTKLSLPKTGDDHRGCWRSSPSRRVLSPGGGSNSSGARSRSAAAPRLARLRRER
jgi:serine/threonine-protein kinase PknK